MTVLVTLFPIMAIWGENANIWYTYYMYHDTSLPNIKSAWLEIISYTLFYTAIQLEKKNTEKGSFIPQVHS